MDRRLCLFVCDQPKGATFLQRAALEHQCDHGSSQNCDRIPGPREHVCDDRGVKRGARGLGQDLARWSDSPRNVLTRTTGSDRSSSSGSGPRMRRADLPEVRRGLYIKLGQGGAWEGDCLARGVLRLGYDDWNPDLWRQRDWKGLEEWALSTGRTQTRGTAKNHVRQIREFNEASADVIWITFSGGRLFWCFALEGQPEADESFDEGRWVRVTQDGWHDRAADGEVSLSIPHLSGRLTRLAAYRGTICELDHDQLEYLIRKLQGKPAHAAVHGEQALGELIHALEPAVRSLGWRDFEILIDLITRAANWRRVDAIGGSQKGIDVLLEDPLTGNHAIVSVKAAGRCGCP